MYGMWILMSRVLIELRLLMRMEEFCIPEVTTNPSHLVTEADGVDQHVMVWQGIAVNDWEAVEVTMRNERQQRPGGLRSYLIISFRKVNSS
jgi:hypothetical protein